MRKIISIAFTAILMLVLTVSASAQPYSREYPDVFNSGSPLWFQCTVQGKGEFIILIDPNTNISSFGFDGTRGYNLINNTGETINGRAYDINSSGGYIVRFPSYYCMQFRSPGSNPSNVWEDVYITNISGTTLNLIDYHGDRGNDYFDGFSIDHRELIIALLISGVVLMLVWRVLRRSSRGRTKFI